MAMIEKVCECGADTCEYHAGDMYRFKHNSLQINPECRFKFKDKTAKVFILNTKLLNSEYYYAYSEWGTSYGRLYKKDDVTYDGILYNEARYTMVRNPFERYFLTPVKKVHNYEVAVVVGDQVFYNQIWDLRAFKHNMRKMFKVVTLKNVNKKVAKQYESSYDLFKDLKVGGVNSGFNNMVKTMSNILKGENRDDYEH